MRRIAVCVAMVVLGAVVVSFTFARERGESAADEKMVFDFETPADVAAWTPVDLAEVKEKSPAPKIELTTEHATNAKGALRLTFDGGNWPAVTTTTIPVPDGWEKFQTIKLDIWASRACVVGMCIGQEKGPAKP